jgi:8-amino-7-oxononanoate synthase
MSISKDNQPSPALSDAPEGWRSLKRHVDEELRLLEAHDAFRTLAYRGERNLIDLTTNDYLGLARSEEFQRTSWLRSEALPAGSSSSRLVGGDHPIFGELEAAFANYKGAETSLYFPSGYAANEGLAVALSFADIATFSDSLNHASIIDGIKVSKVDKSRRFVFPHLDYTSLESMLKKSPAEINLIFVESLFSMDGDLADLGKLADIAARNRGVLLVDEAHSLGCYGPGGNGFIAESGLSHEHLISINPCGKAYATSGALISGPRWLTDLLINKARSFIYTTGPSPRTAMAVLTSLAAVTKMDAERKQLKNHATILRRELQGLGYSTGPSNSHIIPVILGSNARALRGSKALLERGIFSKAIRPPTVPQGEARIRLSLRADITEEELGTICRAFKDIVKRID